MAIKDRTQHRWIGGAPKHVVWVVAHMVDTQSVELVNLTGQFRRRQIPMGLPIGALQFKEHLA